MKVCTCSNRPKSVCPDIFCICLLGAYGYTVFLSMRRYTYISGLSMTLKKGYHPQPILMTQYHSEKLTTKSECSLNQFESHQVLNSMV